MEAVKFIQIQTTPEKLAELIQDGVRSELQLLKKDLLHENANDELLNRVQAAELLQINLSTLWHWQNKGKIKAYGISGKRYYKRSEIMLALKELKK